MFKFNDFTKEIVSKKSEYLKALESVLDSGWFILGKEVELFEKEFSKYLKVKNCIGVANGLEALQISLIAIGINEGDEIMTTPLSAMATTLAILAVGAIPVFVDVDERGLFDTKKAGAKISNKTKAIIPVHLYGQSLQMDILLELCKKYNLRLIEDSCQAHGSKYKNTFLGTLGDLGCFSFYPTKNLGAFGDGGAIVTDNDSLAEKCRVIRDYGQRGKYNHTTYGLNSRLDEMQAAILRVKLKNLDTENKKRRENARFYQKYLSKLPSIKLLESKSYEVENYHQFVIRAQRRDELKRFLDNSNIPTLIHYPKTIPDQPLFGKIYENLDIKVARNFCKEILSLPISPILEESEMMMVVKAIEKFYK